MSQRFELRNILLFQKILFFIPDVKRKLLVDHMCQPYEFLHYYEAETIIEAEWRIYASVI